MFNTGTTLYPGKYIGAATMSSKSRFLKAISVGDFTGLLDTIDLAGPGKEQIPLVDLAGRALSDDVSSEIDVPSFPKSSVDGYAMKARSTFGLSLIHI